MAEIQLTRIKSIYGDLRGLLGQIPLAETNSIVDDFIVTQLNASLDSLSSVAETDFSTYKVPESKRLADWQDSFPASIVRTQLGRVTSRLEQEYGFGQERTPSSPGIVIINKNDNEVSLKINYTIADLISNSANTEVKEKLSQLSDELSEKDKNWSRIKNILIWVLNFSKELFIELIPIILQNKP